MYFLLPLSYSIELKYRATDFLVSGPGKVELVYIPADGGEGQHHELFDFDGSGIAMGMYNTDKVRCPAVSLYDMCWYKYYLLVVKCMVWCGTTLKMVLV